MSSADDAAAVWGAIRAANEAWTQGRPADVAPLFDDAVVMVAPGLEGALEGRDAMVRSYEAFTAVAEVERFDPLERRVDVDGDVAIATYTFRVRYRMNGETHDERGQEVLVFRRRDARWRAVWRTQVPLPGGD